MKIVRILSLVLFCVVPWGGVLGWGMYTYSAWQAGRFGIPRAVLDSEGTSLASGRPAPQFVVWMVQQNIQEEAVLLLASLGLTGLLGFINTRPKAPLPVPLAAKTSWSLSDPLMSLSQSDVWTAGEAMSGSFVVGATGSGKTTGPGAALAKAFLRQGWGGLALCIKPSECETWKSYIKEAGRDDDLIIFDSSGKQRYSFLDEELQRPGAGAGLTENIVSLFTTLQEIADRRSGGKDTEQYWARAQKQLARNLVDLLVMAKGRVTIPDLYRLVVSAPTSFEQLQSEAWRKSSFCFECLQAADQKPKSPREQQDFQLVADYMTSEFPGLSDKTRSVIVSTFTSLVDVFNRGMLRTLFSTDTTVRPEDTFYGKILLVDLPTKEFLEVGLFANVLMKFCFQRAVERRHVDAGTQPVFLWVDECQEVISSSFDTQFQSTARSSRVATVYLTQNISSMRAAFGTEQAETLTDALLGNLQSKFYCANGDPVTNEWAAEICGKSRQFFINASQTESNDLWDMFMGGGQSQRNSGVSEQMEYELPPSTFTRLRTGGPQHHWYVDTILFQGGRVFQQTGKTWLPVTFLQQH